MKRTTIVEIITLLFVTLFLYTGISKLMDYSVFREQIALSPLLAPLSKLISILLPAIEIFVSIILFIPKTRFKGLYASLILMLFFTGYIIYILNFNEHLPCTCGGVLQSLSWNQHLLLNGILICCVLQAIILVKRSNLNKTKNQTSGVSNEIGF
jgi:uncharacterized membrane protein YphA (DoxX/SURF4 family)